jgi:hypothetical protein
VVVASGLTSVDPLAAVGVMSPGLIDRLVAPDVVQLSVLALPSAIPVGLAVNELIVGRFGWVTVTVTVAVTDPEVFVAVSVYVVVAAGLIVIAPLCDVEANVPGATLTLVDPVVAQFSVVVVPAVIAAGLAVNEVIAGAATCGIVGYGCVHAVSPAAAESSSVIAPIPTSIAESPRLSVPFSPRRFQKFMRNLSAALVLQIGRKRPSVETHESGK